MEKNKPKTDFTWFEHARIYQVFTDRFAGTKTDYTLTDLKKGFLYGNLKALIKKLDYIQSMNFNCIWITPFFVNQPNGYHGYHAINMNHVDPRFAFGEFPEDNNIGNAFDENDLTTITKSDQVLIDLIEEMHRRGMKLIMDMVPNHVHYSHPYFVDAAKNQRESKYYNWFYFYEKKEDDKTPEVEKDDAKDNKESQLTNNENANKEVPQTQQNENNNEEFKLNLPTGIDYVKFLDVKELVKLNLDNIECLEYIIAVTKKFLSFGVDAIRMDHIVGPSIQAIKYFCNTIHSLYPTVPIIGEVLPICSSRFSSTILSLSKELLVRLDVPEIEPETIPIVDEAFLVYEGVLDGVLDFSFTFLIELFLKNKLTESELLTQIDKHYKRFEGKQFILPKQLDNHDIDRILFKCNNNRRLFKKVVELLMKRYDGRSDPFIWYYGTEDFMTQEHSQSFENFGDYVLRMPMEFSSQWMKVVFKEKND